MEVELKLLNGDKLPEKAKSVSESDATRSTVNGRVKWSRNLDFILACVGFAVGLGNIWRFPYLCYRNGGGAFLIPYLVCLFCGGIPVLLLEIGLGQYTSTGSIAAWRIVPAFQGIGVASFVITFLMNIYYIVVLAWAFTYLCNSFTTLLPWSHCGNEWNTERCQEFSEPRGTICSQVNVTSAAIGVAPSNCTLLQVTDLKPVDPVVEYWERKILEISDGITEPGPIVWQLAVSLLVVWAIVYFCVWRGIKWSGKVVYFTATFPYVILTCLLIRGATLDGALDGITFYLKPDFTKLATASVWIDGGTQIFFSYAIALGAMITLGSYNKFKNNFYKDVLIISTINSCTSLYGGFAVFSVLGFMAKEQNVTVADVAKSGPGLVFITYPKAVTKMPLPPLWSALFFFMILLVGLDSQFVAVEAIITPLTDMFPRIFQKMRNRMMITAIYCACSFLLGLSMVTQGGMYVFQLFDYYSASGLVLLWVCFFEAIAVGWVFGADRFYDAIETMIGRRISPWWKICWKFLTPAISMGIFLFVVITFEPLKYNSTYVYPRGAQVFGMCLALASMVCIPGVFLVKLASARGNLRERWRTMTTAMVKEPPNHESL